MVTDNKNTRSFSKFLPILGWDSHFKDQADRCHSLNTLPARVTGVHKNYFLVHNGNTEELATVAGKLHFQADQPHPVIGDWVLVADKVIHGVLPRKNALSRGAAGSRGKQENRPAGEQVIAANLDTVFIVSGIDRDFNIRRIERYITLVYNCSLTPAIILTKADLDPDPERFVQKIEAVTFGIPIHLVSAENLPGKDSTGLEAVRPYFKDGRTTAMVGSSGAGKSTLINRLYGKAIQPTSDVSLSVGKGKHTTTSRSLILMPRGGMVIDNPGIREIGLWDDNDGLDTAFPEIENYARQCRFSDCSHTHEPGCRVLEAVETGAVSHERLESYRKMKRELAYLSSRQHKSADRVEKEQWKGVALKIKAMKKRKGR